MAWLMDSRFSVTVTSLDILVMNHILGPNTPLVRCTPRPPHPCHCPALATYVDPPAWRMRPPTLPLPRHYDDP